MIIYNVTVKVEPDIHDDWLEWMRDIHIHDVMNSGIFVKQQMCKIISPDEADGVTYAIQYTCRTVEDFDRYMLDFAPALQAKHNDRYKDKFVAFRTLMEIVE